MRIMVTMTATADMVYRHAGWQSKLRGRVWRALRDTAYDDRHDDNEPPGFAISNPFPPQDMQEGDERKLLIASPDDQLLAYVAADLLADRDLPLGDMKFRVDDVRPLAPDVGEPGTTGTIETSTGLFVRIPPERCDEYGIEYHGSGDSAVYWKASANHPIEPLRKQLVANLDRKHRLYMPDYLRGPSDADGQLFDEYELQKEFAMPIEVATSEELTVVLTKWEFGYEVRDDDHRRHLNLALDCGLGERNSLGFGFTNITERNGEAI